MFICEKYWISQKWKIIFKSFTFKYITTKDRKYNLYRIVWMNIQLTLDILYKIKNNNKKKTFHIFNTNSTILSTIIQKIALYITYNFLYKTKLYKTKSIWVIKI